MTRLDRQPHRVLMTADTVGGVWTYALELAEALQVHGVEVALATMGRPLSREQRQEVRGLPNLQVFESSYKLEWMENPWTDVEKAGQWLLELESKVQPELVHLNGYAHGSLPWQTPKLVVGHSCVLSWWRAVHGTSAPSEWQTYRRAVSAGLHAADMVVAPSRAMLQSLRRHYGTLAATRVIPNGRRLPGNPGQPRLVPCPKEPLVLCAGRLWDEAKNVQTLARIAGALPWPVYLAGERAPLQGEESWQQAVNYLGRLSAMELWPWFKRASIYALPARYEPFGLSVLEAALAGCALVLGDIASLRELWDGAALFVPPDEPEALKEVLQELMASPLWRAALGTKARPAAARYTPERMGRAYLATYAELVDQHKRPLKPAAAAQLPSGLCPSAETALPGMQELAA